MSGKRATSAPRVVLLLGGRSEIGLAVTRRLVAGGATTVVLAGRRTADLDAEEAGLRKAASGRARELVVDRVQFDADELSTHAPLVAEVVRRHGVPDVTLVAFGVLGDQARAERDPAHAAAVVHTDYVAQVSVLTELARVLRAQGRGQLVVFSSVAGVRVRRANYVYGSAKAGLDGFAGGLADALHASGARLLLVRPGFVVGRMTAGMAPAPLSSTPEQVAAAVVRGLRDERSVVWVPPVLRVLATVLTLLPRPLWRRLPR